MRFPLTRKSQDLSPQRHSGTERTTGSRVLLYPAFLCASVSLWLLVFLAVPPTALAAEVRILVQSSPLAGFQYHAGEALWQEMREGDRLTLVREGDNPHDANAVRVEWRGQKLGYLPRAENRTVAAAMDKGEAIDARIAKLRPHKNPWQRVLIEVFVVL